MTNGFKHYPLYITNTLSRTKELFVPISTHETTMYHCGPTVYWHQHLGNMRSVVLADFIYRTLKATGYNPKFVRNYTDVGHLTGDNIGDADAGLDRMQVAAERENLTPQEIADKYIEQYEQDITKLNVIFPFFARATDYIDDMQQLISTLISRDYAYITPLAVYFDVSRSRNYGELSGQKIEELETGSGHGTIEDGNKRNPEDFALWVFKAGEHEHALQTWKSPFPSALVTDGEGFPGWHIECSAMSMKLLGETLDIHLGGIEHIPIHHTNEIAQSEGATGRKFVNYWLHNEHLLVDNQKMSKSEGTTYLLSDIIDRGYDPSHLRYFFMQAHYRSKQNFTWDGLDASRTALERLSGKTLELLSKSHANENKDSDIMVDSAKDKILFALSDDFNTSKALAVINDFIKNEAQHLDKKSLFAFLIFIHDTLGLDLINNTQATLSLDEVPNKVIQLKERRDNARALKDWELSDSLRREIELHGYSIKDSGNESVLELL